MELNREHTYNFHIQHFFCKLTITVWRLTETLTLYAIWKT